MAHIIVLGNEKGGAGKSTLAMHISVAILLGGASLAVLDLDLRQISLKRFFENREAFCARTGITLPCPTVLESAPLVDATEDPAAAFDAFLATEGSKVDFILIDCPGALTPLSQQAHKSADTLVTPLNDSFIDFDLLARIDPETHKVKGPSIYSEMVWDARKERSLGGKTAINWIVARNRLSALNMHNKRRVGEALQDLSRRIGFRFVAGLSDRVIYRELFPNGLTLLDHKQVEDIPTKMSNIAARQEVRDLMLELDLPDFQLSF